MLNATPTEEVTCILCSSRHGRRVFADPSLQPNGRRFAVVECAACGFRFTSPRPTLDAMPQFYPKTYGPYQGFDRKVPALYDPRNTLRARLKNRLKYAVLTRHYGCRIQADSAQGFGSHPLPAALEQLAFRMHRRRNPRLPIRSGPGRALDIGCGNGAHLLFLHSLGWEVTGFDLNDNTDPAVKEAGIPVLTGSLNALQTYRGIYDVVSMWHVLEHLHDPVAELTRVRELLSPDGTLVVEVPNSGSTAARLLGCRWHQWDLPRHLSHFTPRTLARVLALAGLRVQRLSFLRKTALLQSLRAWAEAPGSPRLLKAVQGGRGFRLAAGVLGFPLSLVGPGENLLAVAGN